MKYLVAWGLGVPGVLIVAWYLLNHLYWLVAGSSLAWKDSPANITVFPFEGAGCFRIGADVAHKLSSEIVDRSENAASDDFALQPCEPDFNLIQPGRIGAREVKFHVGVSPQELFDLVGLVRRQIVENDVNLLVRLAAEDYLFEETNEFRTGVSLGGLALYLPRLSSAAYRDNVPLRRYSKPSRSSRPGDNGSTGSRRSSA